MNRLSFGASLLAAALLLTGTPASAADGNSPLAKDLTATISLLGLPCGQVVSVATQGNNDHLATCSNGSRYRVYVNAQGRVTAEKR
ncbi:MAG: hypothetical protein KF771_00620 [Burkholderiales bacterium]|nr:hypothetical protein [Burkholderiales bacterium]